MPENCIRHLEIGCTPHIGNGGKNSVPRCERTLTSLYLLRNSMWRISRISKCMSRPQLCCTAQEGDFTPEVTGNVSRFAETNSRLRLSSKPSREGQIQTASAYCTAQTKRGRRLPRRARRWGT